MENRIYYLGRLLNSIYTQTTKYLRTVSLAVLMFVALVAFGQVAIPTTPNAVLQDGVVYTVSSNTIITATTAGQSGLQVAQGAKVVINIKKNVTLTVTGANADASKGFGGMPGILVPKNSTLVLIGEGTLVANGGSATDGMAGENGEDAGGRPAGVKSDDTNRRFTYTYSAAFPNYGGYGGAGGDGGYGAGAAIGGEGGHGGKGGVQRERANVSISYTGLEGNAGGAATKSGDMGEVYVLGNTNLTTQTLKVTATAGNAGSAGAAGKNGYYGYTTSKVDGKYYTIGGGGGGGGGAAGSKPSYAIGAGGIAGGGAGSGGQGGSDNSGTYQLTYGGVFGIGAMNQQNASCEGGPGSGGNTAADKRDSGNGKTTFWIWGSYTQKGGAGGVVGGAGESGDQGKLYILGTAPNKRINNSSSNQASSTTYINNATTLKNNYSAIVALYQVTISFDNQGGSTARASVDMIKGDVVESLSNFAVPTKTGYYFDGYYTEPEGGERIFGHNGVVVDASRTFTENKTLYAHWISNQFKITWDYSYYNQNNTLQNLNSTDKSKYAKVQFNVGNAFLVQAGAEANGTGAFAGHRIATATITAEVGSGTDTSSKIYVTEDQLRCLQISAIALSSNSLSATDNKYISTNTSTHDVVLSAIPAGTFMQPWSITITNEKKPDVLNVKLLRSNSPDGTYEVINQLSATSVACSGSNGVYTGTYPVWPESALNEKLYYKVQIVGYEIDGVSHSVANMPMTSNVSSEANQQTLTQEIALPIVRFDLNAPAGTTPHYASGTTEYQYASSYGETIDLKKYSASLENCRLEGWANLADDILNSVVANGDVHVYASWADAVPPVITFTGEKYIKGDEDENGYYHESLEVYVHIEDANDGAEIEQWYYVAETLSDIDESKWIPLTKTANGNHTIMINDAKYTSGYVYVKSTDKDGNTSYQTSNQYILDRQAPVIKHTPLGRREDSYSVVCTDSHFESIEVDVIDNVGVTQIMVNGGIVDVTKTQKAEELELIGVSTKNGKIYLEKPGENDRERDDDGKPVGPIPAFKNYTITARDAAGNTSTRQMTVYTEHEWEMNEDGSYKIQDGVEPTESEPGMLSHVDCQHCSRYILINKDAQWIKIDTENIQDMEQVKINIGSVLVKGDGDRIYYADPTINGALTSAKNTYNNTTNGVAKVIKLTPNSVGAKVDADDLSNATLINPARSIILDLNGQSIDNDGVAYEIVTGNANVTILLNDGNNRKAEFNNVDEIPYSNLSPVTGSPIKYVRKFSATQGKEGTWQSLYLPFSVERPNDMTMVGTVKKVVIDDESAKLWINKWEDGDGNTTLEAFTPYFIQHAAGDMVLIGTTGLKGYAKKPAAEIDGGNYTITGSLKTDDNISEVGKRFWTLNNSGNFGWANYGLSQRPYRWVIYGEPSSDINPSATTKTLKLCVYEPEMDSTTGVNKVEIIDMNDVYSVSGMKISKNAKLPRGIYISNGKKFNVK